MQLIKQPPNDPKLIEASMKIQEKKETNTEYEANDIVLSSSDKWEIKKNIEKLEKHELLQIYYILQDNEKNNYSQNHNGIWFDLLKLKDNTQIKIHKYKI